MQRPRKPGDQAPPFRPIHRNPGKTAQTHVKSTAGKLYLVHDGDGNVLELGGVRAEGMTYDEARKFKDYAVTKHKQRRAGVREMVWTEAMEQAHADDEQIAKVDPDSPRVDPVLERNRQAALAAAKPVAAAANARVAARPPAPPPKKPAAAVQRAPGWEPPPAGVTGARQAPKPAEKNAPIVRAPGFEAPTGGAKSTAPKTSAAVEIDPIDGDDSLELGDQEDVSDLINGGGDLDSEVKRAVETSDNRVIEACKQLQPGHAVLYFSDENDSGWAKVIAVHAPTCITIQVPRDADELETIETIEKTVPTLPGEAPYPVVISSDLTGPVLKSVMLTPKEGKRAGTWQPILL